MASNFFQRQEKARQRTGWLVLLFVVGLVGIVTSTSTIAYLLAAMAVDEAQGRSAISPLAVMTVVALATIVIILFGSLFKIFMLRSGGGQGVAESLGGTRILPATEVPEEKRLLNIVEEMALASGTPVPPVFLLRDEPGINAFAAGYTPQDAVIGVTQGAIELLDRDQLQGVIAHEFSHIFNGDMRLGIRIIGILHGILLLNLMGQFLFRMSAYGSHRSSRNSSKGNSSEHVFLFAILVSVILIIIGSIGSFIGALIKAAVSRQREYLADASAVQFTRNPVGLSGALKTIAAYSAGSSLQSANAAEASHLFFASGIQGGFASWFSTHPPLRTRILALEPSWNGVLPKVTGLRQRESQSKAIRHDPSHPQRSSFSDQVSPWVPAARPLSNNALRLTSPDIQYAVEHVGIPEQTHQEYAKALISQIPPSILSLLRDPFESRAVVFALLSDRSAGFTPAQRETLLGNGIEEAVVTLTHKIAVEVQQLPAAMRLPMIDLAIPALKSMSAAQYQTFEKALSAVMRADRKLSVFEWGLSSILVRHLRSQYANTSPPRIDYFALQRLGKPISVVLSTVARTGHSEEAVYSALITARHILPEVPIDLAPREACHFKNLEEAIKVLRRTSFRQRGRILDAAAAIVCSDKTIRPAEAELLRGIADMLESPMPPILPGQPVT